MKLPVSNKTSSARIKPHIKKGYYPGKLLMVEQFKDKDGNPRVGKYGLQLILEFAVYKPDPETDAPTKPMKVKLEDGSETEVVLSKFVYYAYKKTDKNGTWTEGEYQTAITPNSAITKILKSLGWEFTTEDVDPEDFIGKWAELNIDDYEVEKDGETMTLSTIKDINPYTGPEIGNVEEVKAKEKPQEVKKQIKHDSVEKKPVEEKPKAEMSEEEQKLEQQKEKLNSLKTDGLISEEGYKQGIEQLNAEIAKLKK